MSTTKKCYSHDNETFQHSELGDLFDELDSDGELVVGRVYYEADCREIGPSDFTGKWRVDSILEQFDEDLFEEVGEIADNDFSGASADAKDELRTLLNAWIAKHVNTRRYWKIIGEPRLCHVTEDDLACAPSTLQPPAPPTINP